MAEILAAELCADAERLGQLEDALLHLEVTEAVAADVTARRKRVEVAGACVLRGLQRVLRRRAADDDGQVVRRARGGAERTELLVEEREQPLLVEHRLGLLEQVG